MKQKRFVLIGHPVAHSLSPAIHHAAYGALGLPHRYELVDCPDLAHVERALEAIRRGEIEGANVTVPWKREALKLADRVAPGAQRVGAANVLVRGADGALVAHNTDVLALVEEFQRLVTTVRRVVVIGNGGAAPAVVVAAREAGAEVVTVTARKFLPSEPAESWPHAAEFSARGAALAAWPGADADAQRRFNLLLSRVDLLVQCTSAGMHGADDGQALANLIPWEHLPQCALAYDLIYNPANTPFLEGARAAGLGAENGLGMLVAQAAKAIELWLSVVPPRAPLESAAREALAARSRA